MCDKIENGIIVDNIIDKVFDKDFINKLDEGTEITSKKLISLSSEVEISRLKECVDYDIDVVKLRNLYDISLFDDTLKTILLMVYARKVFGTMNLYIRIISGVDDSFRVFEFGEDEKEQVFNLLKSINDSILYVNCDKIREKIKKEELKIKESELMICRLKNIISDELPF